MTFAHARDASLAEIPVPPTEIYAAAIQLSPHHSIVKTRMPDGSAGFFHAECLVPGSPADPEHCQLWRAAAPRSRDLAQVLSHAARVAGVVMPPGSGARGV